MTEIILARHGETEWNVAEIFRGRINIELNEAGKKQAELLGDYLAATKIEAVYSSPLKRALTTAGAIAKCQSLEVETAQALIDADFGEWEGLPVQEVKEKYPELYVEWVNHPDKVKIPGGESLNDVMERAMAVISSVAEEHQGTVVLVSHRVVNKVLTCAMLGLDNSHFWSIRQDNCGITIFDCRDRRFILTRHNDTSFLRPLAKSELADF